ncbi:MAG: helix-turn-helix domain-containing protein [Flammeovirgaceae bacterium]
MEQPSFDTWESIFLFAAVQGIFLALTIVIQKAKKWQANYYLAATVLLFSIMLVYYVGYWTGYNQLLPRFLSAVEGFTLLISPTLLFYVKSFKKAQKPKALFIHFALFPIYVIFRFWAAWPWAPLLQCLHLLVYSIWIWKESKPLQHRGLRRFLPWAYVMYTFSFWAYYVLVATGNLRVEYDYAISMLISIVIYYIGYVGYQQQSPLIPKYHNAALPNSLSNEIVSKLQHYFEKEQPYLSGELRLGNIAQQLGFSNQQVSQVINQELGKSFSDFVNEYRVAIAKEKLLQTQDKVEHIAFDSGFNNKVSFYQAFKKSTGVSPSQFRKQN